MPTWNNFSTRVRSRSSTSWTACSTGVREMRIFPVMCASAIHNIGSDLIMNLIVEDMPNPTERGEITAFVNGTEATQIAESDLPSAYVFKTTADPFAGRITYFRVNTGIIKNDVTLQTK